MHENLPVGDENNLIACWQFNARNGDVAYDHSGNQNHGTITDATWESNEVTYISVPEDYSGIMEAMEYVTEGDTIFVSAGQYDETVIFPEFDIFLIGEDSSNTFINGDNNHRGVLINNGGGGLISGFTISDCELSEFEDDEYEYNGSGIYIGNGSSPIIRNCIIQENQAFGMGGGLYIDNDSHPTIENCIIRFNESQEANGGGIYIGNGSSPIIKDCLISDNQAYGKGGGMYIGNNSQPVVNDCIIRSNESQDEGGGIAIFSGALNTLNFQNLIIEQNQAYSFGGGIFVGPGDDFIESDGEDSSFVHFDTLLLKNNHSEAGAAIYAKSNCNFSYITAFNNDSQEGVFQFAESWINIWKTTIVNNYGSSQIRKDDDYSSDGYLGISTSILYDSDYHIETTYGDSSNIYIDNSNIQGGWWNSGYDNFDQDPLFCNSNEGDYSLAENSPCLGQNNNLFSENIGAIGIGCEALVLPPELNIEDFEGLWSIMEDETDTLEVIVQSIGDIELLATSNFEHITLSTIELYSNNIDTIVFGVILIPDPDFFSEYEFEINLIATDNLEQSSSAMIYAVIEPVNDAPVIADIADQVTDEDTPLRILLSITDVDNEYIDFYVRDDMVYNTDAYIVSNGDSLLLVPHPNWYGEENIYILATDGEFEVQNSFTLTVNPVDDDPMVSGYMPDLYFYEDFEDTLREDLRGLFEDVDGELTFSVAFENENILNAEVEGDTMLTLSPLANANGVTEMHITASNPTRASVTDTVLVTVFEVNDPPEISEMAPITMEEDTPYEFMSMTSLFETGLITDIDNTLEELNFHLHPESDHIFVDWDGELTSMPMIVSDQDYFGTGLLNLCVMDSYDEMCMMIDVEVTPVNDAPYFVSEMHAPVGVTLEFNLMLDVMDVDSENLTVSLTDGETNPAFVSVMDNILIGTPDELGMFPVYLSLSDGEITVLDTFELHVVNFVPEIVAIEDIPNDQGGRVYVGFTASFMDMGEEGGQNYDVLQI